MIAPHGKGVMLMIKLNKNEIIKYGLIASLFTNFTIGARYTVDGKEYQEKTKNLTLSYHHLDQKYKHTIELAKEINDISRNKTDKIMDLTEQLEKVKNENKLIHKDNERLKKEIQRKEVSSQRKLNMELTYYTARCYGCSGITKTGINVTNTTYYKGMKIVAADPRVIKLHSIIKIETKNDTYIAYVGDTGGAIKGNILDVLVGSKQEALNLGRNHATVTILREGS
jgi:3D (Asp-Asp-Asp) domain-containing protein